MVKFQFPPLNGFRCTLLTNCRHVQHIIRTYATDHLTLLFTSQAQSNKETNISQFIYSTSGACLQTPSRYWSTPYMQTSTIINVCLCASVSVCLHHNSKTMKPSSPKLYIHTKGYPTECTKENWVFGLI